MNISYNGSQGSKASLNGQSFELRSGLKITKLHSKYYLDEMNGNDAGFIIFEGSKSICEAYPKDKLEIYLNKNGIKRKCYDDEEEIYLGNGILNIETIKPDNCIINNLTKTAYIIEQKFQCKKGSVDEKIRTYDYRQRYFNLIFSLLGYKLKLIYILNDWYKKSKYRLVRKFMIEDGVDIYYNELPPHAIGLDEI